MILSRLRTITVRIGRVARDAWLIVGITLALILGLEAAYRVQGAVRGMLSPIVWRAETAPPSPLTRLDWWADYDRDHRAEKDLKWTSYVYVRNPTFVGTHITVDSAGHRVTPQPEGTGDRTIEVFFLGGSTTFGWFQRQAFTIPALAAQRLSSALEPGSRLRVTNFGVPGRTFTQELIELLLQLQAGARPDVVVFYDGINDVMATVQNGVAGLPQNEANRVADFERGRRLEAESRPGLANAMREVGSLGWSLVRRSELVARVQSVRAPAPRPPVSTDLMAASLARVYVENVRLVEALGARYGFTALYVWQPSLMSTRKRLTAREAWLRRPADADPEIRPMRDLHIAVPPLLRATVPRLVGERFVDATTLYDADPLDVFGDLFGHTYERANQPVVDLMVSRLSDMVTRAGRRPTPDGRRAEARSETR